MRKFFLQATVVVCVAAATGEAAQGQPPAFDSSVNDPYLFTDYKTFRERVAGGYLSQPRLLVGDEVKNRYVGSYLVHCWVPSGYLLGVSDGEYRCFGVNGDARMEKVVAVASSSPTIRQRFQAAVGGGFGPTSSLPACATGQCGGTRSYFFSQRR